MMQWGYNIRLYILLTKDLCIPTDTYSSPHTSKMHAIDDKKPTKDRQWTYLWPTVSIT